MAMCLASRRSFSRPAELSARVHEREPDGRLASLGPGVPAESPDRDKAAHYPPDREDQQLAAGESAVQGERVQQRLVERPDREDTRQVIEEPGGDLEVGAGDEHEREEDELHYRGRGLRVADEAGDRDSDRKSVV